jgi:hypothetical protein
MEHGMMDVMHQGYHHHHHHHHHHDMDHMGH